MTHSTTQRLIAALALVTAAAMVSSFVVPTGWAAACWCVGGGALIAALVLALRGLKRRG
ncbi:hypothetical protein [Leifsonia xyli]|uniref:hypothetical protein n=1 Tax=Leifsonia xyli TaxID=1575 RepID=UPI000B04D2F7